MTHPIYVFDAYGTLFDVHSAVERHRELVGPNATQVSQLWRIKQLEYSWIRGRIDKYVDFWSLTEESLDFALNSIEGANKDARKSLLTAYESLDCYAEVVGVLTRLKSAGANTAILSNGSPPMLESAVNHAKINSLLDAVISVDSARTYKPAAKVYQLACDFFKCEKEDVFFQSSNCWDIAGAKSFGFNCNWINRSNQRAEYIDLVPNNIYSDLNGILGT